MCLVNSKFGWIALDLAKLSRFSFNVNIRQPLAGYNVDQGGVYQMSDEFEDNQGNNTERERDPKREPKVPIAECCTSYVCIRVKRYFIVHNYKYYVQSKIERNVHEEIDPSPLSDHERMENTESHQKRCKNSLFHHRERSIESPLIYSRIIRICPAQIYGEKNYNGMNKSQCEPGKDPL